MAQNNTVRPVAALISVHHVRLTQPNTGDEDTFTNNADTRRKVYTSNGAMLQTSTSSGVRPVAGHTDTSVATGRTAGRTAGRTHGRTT